MDTGSSKLKRNKFDGSSDIQGENDSRAKVKSWRKQKERLASAYRRSLNLFSSRPITTEDSKFALLKSLTNSDSETKTGDVLG